MYSTEIVFDKWIQALVSLLLSDPHSLIWVSCANFQYLYIAMIWWRVKTVLETRTSAWGFTCGQVLHWTSRHWKSSCPRLIAISQDESAQEMLSLSFHSHLMWLSDIPVDFFFKWNLRFRLGNYWKTIRFMILGNDYLSTSSAEGEIHTPRISV